MTEVEAEKVLGGIFVAGERAFLFQHPRFKAAIVTATEMDVARLSDLGTELLLEGEYKPYTNPI